MKIPNTETYRELLSSEIEKHTARGVQLVFVDDVACWAPLNCPDIKNNPIAAAFHSSAIKDWGIVFRRSLSTSAIRSVVDGIDWRVGGGSRLNTPSAFIRHLVLHELAHLIHGWDQSKEADCDLWAFARL